MGGAVHGGPATIEPQDVPILREHLLFLPSQGVTQQKARVCTSLMSARKGAPMLYGQTKGIGRGRIQKKKHLKVTNKKCSAIGGANQIHFCPIIKLVLSYMLPTIRKGTLENNHCETQSHCCDTSVEHTKKHIEDKPEGSKEYTFIHFLSPAIVKSGGELVEADTGACLVYSPGHPQHYAGRGKRWSNDWATFTGTSAEKLVHEAKVPINRVFYPSRTHFVASLLEKIKYERSKPKPGDNVATMALNEVFIKLARFSKEDAASFPLRPLTKSTGD